MLRRGTVFIVALACCAYAIAEPEGTKGGRPAGNAAADPAPEIFVTGIILNKALKGNDVNIDLKGVQREGIPISPDVQFTFNHSIALHVRCKTCAKPQDFMAFLSPNDPDDPTDYVTGKVTTGSASVRIDRGWLILLGEMPIGKTTWGSSTASGTAMAIRVDKDPATGRMAQWVYNLEPANSAEFVTVEIPNYQSKDVKAGKRILCTTQPTQQPEPVAIPASEKPRIEKVKKLAKQVGVDVDRVPADPNSN